MRQELVQRFLHIRGMFIDTDRFRCDLAQFSVGEELREGLVGGDRRLDLRELGLQNLLLVLFLLFFAFRRLRYALLILANVPFVLIGGIALLFFGPFMLAMLTDFAARIFTHISHIPIK